jgi:hypothetical protein
MPVGSTKWRFIFPWCKERCSRPMTSQTSPKWLTAYWPSSRCMNKSPNRSSGNLPATTSTSLCTKFPLQHPPPWRLDPKIRHRIYAPKHLGIHRLPPKIFPPAYLQTVGELAKRILGREKKRKKGGNSKYDSESSHGIFQRGCHGYHDDVGSTYPNWLQEYLANQTISAR